MNIRRGEIHVAALDPIVGREIAKTRPVVVVSNDKNNQFSGTVTVVPITSRNLERVYPFEVLLREGAGNLPKDSKARADQIRTLDRSRLRTCIGRLGPGEIAQIEAAIRVHLQIS